MPTASLVQRTKSRRPRYHPYRPYPADYTEPMVGIFSYLNAFDNFARYSSPAVSPVPNQAPASNAGPVTDSTLSTQASIVEIRHQILLIAEHLAIIQHRLGGILELVENRVVVVEQERGGGCKISACIIWRNTRTCKERIKSFSTVPVVPKWPCKFLRLKSTPS